MKTVKEEIAEWLREVEQEYKQLASDIKHPFSMVALKAQIKWGKRAKQVENMRCENCSKHFEITGDDGEGIPCPWSGSGSCWNFKSKGE